MKALYKIFLVEDEIVTRESIRDRVDWKAAGFEFSGEAPDGEIALPLIQEIQPDVLITDIKMPFMDGLELCRLVRETMPHIKTIILSGHDEFDYAREAIQLGVTEYLLKPTSPQDLLTVLQKISRQIDQESAEREHFQGLQEQLEDNLSLLQEKFLLQLVLGKISSVEAIKQSMRFKLNLIARWYMVIFLKTEYHGSETGQLNEELNESENILSEVTHRMADALIFKKGMDEIVLILKGDRQDHLEQDSYLLTEAIKEEIRNKTHCQMVIGISTPCDHICDISPAFFKAFEMVHSAPQPARPGAEFFPLKPMELTRLDPGATETYLNYGTRSNFDAYFEGYTRQVPEEALRSRIFLDYIFMDVVITVANFINELGGEPASVIPELGEEEVLQGSALTLTGLRQRVQNILGHAIDFRNLLIGTQYGMLINRAQNYIDTHFEDPKISLKMVSSQVNLSPSHFSVVFSRETGGTFIEYLTRKRLEKAIALLTTSLMQASEIAERVGYGNPHYFSTVFKKFTGLPPMEFRSKYQKGNPGRKDGLE